MSNHVWWSDDYIAGRLAAGRSVPERRLMKYYADCARLVKPDTCPHCGSSDILFLTRNDLNLPARSDNLVYLCGGCRGNLLKKYNRERNRRPRGRPKKSAPEKEKLITASDLAKLYWNYRKALPVQTMDDR